MEECVRSLYTLYRSSGDMLLFLREKTREKNISLAHVSLVICMVVFYLPLTWGISLHQLNCDPIRTH